MINALNTGRIATIIAHKAIVVSTRQLRSGEEIGSSERGGGMSGRIVGCRSRIFSRRLAIMAKVPVVQAHRGGRRATKMVLEGVI